MKSVIVDKPDRILNGSIALPSSKSISNRLLIIQALTGKEFPMTNLSDADDTCILSGLLDRIKKSGTSFAPLELDAGNAGTTFRFLTAFLAVRPGSWLLTGSERMQQRPAGPLVEALRSLGASIDYLSEIGYPPLLIRGKLLNGGKVMINAGISSQFISALLLVAPSLSSGLKIVFKGKEVSSPYISMTVNLLRLYGIKLRKEMNSITVHPGVFVPKPYTVEADWSSAAFWYEAVALSEVADLMLKGLRRNSLQGDSILPEIFRHLGVKTVFKREGIQLIRSGSPASEFCYDFTHHPDLAQPVIATCAALGLRGHFDGLENLRIKECDRVEALKVELEKLGVKISLNQSGLPGTTLDLMSSRPNAACTPVVETYGDHRMVMAFAPLSMITGSLRIKGPDEAVKSYRGFWDDLERVGFRIEEVLSEGSI
jgi:3-phosphoshikimate 1-carboxyvinyltransferase